MGRPALIQDSFSEAQLLGDLTLDTSHKLLHEGLLAISRASTNGDQQWTIDCRKVGEVSSATVALILQWWRACQSRQVQLRLENLPSKLLPLMMISEVEPLLQECIVTIYDASTPCDHK